jgi:acetyl-CoA carboxylase / biotin carboxylase 1
MQCHTQVMCFPSCRQGSLHRSHDIHASVAVRLWQATWLCAQVAVAYAAMHDTPARMLAVGVLRGIVPWRQARAFFVLRLRRR